MELKSTPGMDCLFPRFDGGHFHLSVRRHFEEGDDGILDVKEVLNFKVPPLPYDIGFFPIRIY